ncbi:MAG: TrkA family potassium uptake protein [candidate division WOR-3 bacterium]|nr:TrkA family potassium uptake protein [candidate division WOR-3 bacterium]
MKFVVIGLGTFGKKVALTLVENGSNVVVIDKDKERVEEVKDKVEIALTLDSTDEEAMQAAQIDDVDAAVVALGDAQEEAILTTVILKKIGISPIIARAANSLYSHVLKLVGADRVIIIEEQMGEDIAKRLLAPEIHERIVLTTGTILAEVEAKKEFIGKTLQELDLRRRFGVNVIAIHKKVTKINETGKVYECVEVNDLPSAMDRIEEGNILVLVGSGNDIENLLRAKEKK